VEVQKEEMEEEEERLIWNMKLIWGQLKSFKIYPCNDQKMTPVLALRCVLPSHGRRWDP
jgi:hypothetical protein